jgi:hypothetical protein
MPAVLGVAAWAATALTMEMRATRPLASMMLDLKKVSEEIDV